MAQDIERRVDNAEFAFLNALYDKARQALTDARSVAHELKRDRVLLAGASRHIDDLIARIPSPVRR